MPFNSSIVNLAIGQPTKQSSTMFGADSSRAVDGIVWGDFIRGQSCSQTSYETNPWFRVELRKHTGVRSVRYTFSYNFVMLILL